MPTATSWMTDRGDAPAPKARRAAGTRSATASPARRAVGLQERPASAARAGGGGARPGKPKPSGDATSRRRLPFEPLADGGRTTAAAAAGGIYNPYNSTPCIPNGLLQKGLSANEVVRPRLGPCAAPRARSAPAPRPPLTRPGPRAAARSPRTRCCGSRCATCP